MRVQMRSRLISIDAWAVEHVNRCAPPALNMGPCWNSPAKPLLRRVPRTCLLVRFWSSWGLARYAGCYSSVVECFGLPALRAGGSDTLEQMVSRVRCDLLSRCLRRRPRWNGSGDETLLQWAWHPRRISLAPWTPDQWGQVPTGDGMCRAGALVSCRAACRMDCTVDSTRPRRARST